MPAIVRKSAAATNGIVCLGQSCSTSNEGLVTVQGRFLLRTENDKSLFVPDSRWPDGSSPRGLPRNQGGPYLFSVAYEYANGLIFANAAYVTATNPVRVVYSQSRASRAFAGVVIIVDDESVPVTVSAKFDYTSTVASATYTLLDRQTFNPDLSAAKINSITGGAQEILGKILKKNIDSEERTTIGRVTQVTASREVVFYQ
jgi:hypothetical protein